ncbi:hypothetical protein V1523DRAFT_418611 [Lipomyces doorenjongii]
MRRAGKVLMFTTQVAPALYVNHTSELYHPHTEMYVEQIHSMGHVNVTLAASIFHNRTGLLEEMGYILQFYSDEYSHTALISEESLDDALETLVRFDGRSHTKSSHYREVFGRDPSLQKRGTTYQWISYTGWAGNTGYIGDLENWNEYTRFANEYEFDDVVGDIEQVQPCTTFPECYAVYDKYCTTIGMSRTQGIDDAEVGEVYYMAYGGLDNDCEQG